MRETTPQFGDSSSNRNCLAEFGNSALYAAAEEPIRGVAQVVDHFAGMQLDTKVKESAAYIGIEAPQAAQFGTANWYAL